MKAVSLRWIVPRGGADHRWRLGVQVGVSADADRCAAGCGCGCGCGGWGLGRGEVDARCGVQSFLSVISSYVRLICFMFSTASGPALSGWWRRARFRYAFLTSASVALVGRPRVAKSSCGEIRGDMLGWLFCCLFWWGVACGVEGERC